MGLASLVLLVVFGAATAREVAIGREEVAAADASSLRGAWPEAIAHARGAALALAPASPWPEQGKRRLVTIGQDAEHRGDAPVALLAYGALRTAALATRAPLVDRSEWRSVAEQGLARMATLSNDTVGAPAGVAARYASLSSAERTGTPVDPRSDESAKRMLQVLSREEIPAVWALTTLAAAVSAMVAGVLWFLVGGPSGRREALAIAIALVGLVAYGTVLFAMD